MYVTLFDCSSHMFVTCSSQAYLFTLKQKITLNGRQFQSCDEHIVEQCALYQLSYSNFLIIQDIKTLYTMIIKGQVTNLLLMLHTTVICQNF